MRVLPLVERLRLVEPLVALQADELVAERAGDHLGELGLADAGGSFDQHRLLQRRREVDDGRDGAVADVLLLAEALDHLVDAREARIRVWHGAPARVPQGSTPDNAFRRKVAPTLVCTLALYREALAGIPLLVAANRDEFYARPSRDPERSRSCPA